MSHIPTILASLDARLDQLAIEISTLEDARTALQARALPAPEPATTPSAATAKPPRRSTAKTKTPPAKSLPTPTGPLSNLAATAAAAPKSASSTTRRQKSAKSPPTNRVVSSLSAERLERLLSDSQSGLSAAAIAEQASAPDRQVLALLRALEASGKVRRTGQRRSTLWHLITDEDRIAERAAELERQFAARRGDRTQRRGRARAS
jgi:hypothetical protein